MIELIITFTKFILKSSRYAKTRITDTKWRVVEWQIYVHLLSFIVLLFVARWWWWWWCENSYWVMLINPFSMEYNRTIFYTLSLMLSILVVFMSSWKVSIWTAFFYIDKIFCFHTARVLLVYFIIWTRNQKKGSNMKWTNRFCYFDVSINRRLIYIQYVKKKNYNDKTSKKVIIISKNDPIKSILYVCKFFFVLFS